MVDRQGNESWYSRLAQTKTYTNLEHPISDKPQRFALHSNYPNPFNPSTTIRYTLPEESPVQLTIYNALGREIETLVNTRKASGSYQVRWDAANYSSGIYLYRFEAGDYIKTRKMTLVK